MLHFTIHTQPDDESCGPTSLHAIYQHYALNIPLETVLQEVERSHSGGTLGSMLGIHALKQGLQVCLYVNNLNLFDPTWFSQGESDPEFLIQKLTAQMAFKTDPRMLQASRAHINFLMLGGRICFKTVTVALLKEYFAQNIPVLAGLSATYLYRSPRERFTPQGESIYDDIRGTPCGHFVVLCGYDDTHRHIIVADPHRENPLSHDNYYKVSSHHLINAILLGVLTYDANLLIIQR